MKSYSAVKRHELLSHTTTWGNPESITQSTKSSDTQDYNIIPFTFSSRKKYRDSRSAAARGWGGGEELSTKTHGGTFWGARNILYLEWGGSSCLYTFAKTHLSIHLKWVNFYYM